MTRMTIGETPRKNQDSATDGDAQRGPRPGALRVLGMIWQGTRTMDDRAVDAYADELRQEGIFDDSDVPPPEGNTA